MAGGDRPNLGSAVEAAEAALFTGRAAELALLPAAVAACRQAACVLYVWGPPGVGKSALLRAYGRWARAAGLPAAAVDGTVVGDHPQALLRSLATALRSRPAGAEAGSPSVGAVVRATGRRARGSGLLLLVDAYDELPESERWFRTEVLYALGPGTCIVLAGQHAPEDLWPQDPAWRQVVRPVPLSDLGRDEAREYLRRRGVRAEVLEPALAVAGGRPLLLHCVAEIVRRQGPPAVSARWPAAPGGLGAALLREVTRGVGLPILEEAFGAATVPRTFDRGVLEAMLGQVLSAPTWETLVGLPMVARGAGRFWVHESVRAGIRAEVLRERPWVVRRWRRRAIEYYLQPERAASSWGEIAHLAAGTAWHRWLHPPAEAERRWRIERGATGADAEALVRCRVTALRWLLPQDGDAEAGTAEAVRALVAGCPEGFIVARDAEGLVQGYTVAVPWHAGTRALLAGDARIGPSLGRLPAGVLNAWEGQTLVVGQVGMREPDTQVHHALFREMFSDFAPYARVVGVPPSARAEAFLCALGFERQDGPGPDGRPDGGVFALDLAALGYARWLRGLAAEGPGPGVPEAGWAAAAQAGLEALATPGLLPATPAAAHFQVAYGVPPSPEALRAWLEDGLDQLPAGPGRQALVAYFLRRSGSHEAIAERLGLSRRTYFRRWRGALTDLGRILFQ